MIKMSYYVDSLREIENFVNNMQKNISSLKLDSYGIEIMGTYNPANFWICDLCIENLPAKLRYLAKKRIEITFFVHRENEKNINKARETLSKLIGAELKIFSPIKKQDAKSIAQQNNKQVQQQKKIQQPKFFNTNPPKKENIQRISQNRELIEQKSRQLKKDIISTQEKLNQIMDIAIARAKQIQSQKSGLNNQNRLQQKPNQNNSPENLLRQKAIVVRAIQNVQEKQIKKFQQKSPAKQISDSNSIKEEIRKMIK